MRLRCYIITYKKNCQQIGMAKSSCTTSFNLTRKYHVENYKSKRFPRHSIPLLPHCRATLLHPHITCSELLVALYVSRNGAAFAVTSQKIAPSHHSSFLTDVYVDTSVCRILPYSILRFFLFSQNVFHYEL